MDNIENEVASELAKQIPVKEIYGDAKELVKKAELLLPNKAYEWLQTRQLRSLIGKYNIEATKKLLLQKLECIDSALIEPPAYHIAIPATLALSYSMDSEELRSMYANLLAASMVKTTKQFVHPSFVEIIKQFSPDEAKVFNRLPPKGRHEPIVDITKEIEGHDGVFTHCSNISVLGFEAECEFPDNIPQYIDNLCRLGLTEIPTNSFLIDEWRYDKITEHNFFKQSIQSLQQFQIIKKSFGITDFGNSFKLVCLPDSTE